MPIINVPKVLREKLGEEGADALVELINAADSQAKADVLTFVEEKFERRLSEELAKVDGRITTETGKLGERLTSLEAQFERRLSEEMRNVAAEFASVRKEMAELKADLIRWMFIFWVGQLGAVVGILVAFFRR